MIRINLIQTPAAEVEGKAADVAGLRGQKALYPLLALVLCFACVGLFYWVSTRSITTLTRQMQIEQREAARLAALEAQNKNYQAQLEEINQHINVIQELQKQRTGPRDLMTLLGGAADRVNGLYFLSVDTSKGRLKIQGRSDDADALANFITALEGERSFSDVELHSLFEDDRYSQVSFKFDLDCLYKPPVDVAASTAPVPPTGAAERPPGR